MRVGSLDPITEKKKSFLVYYILTGLIAVMVFYFLSGIIFILKILISLAVKHWIYFIITIAVLLIAKKFLAKRKRKRLIRESEIDY